MLHEWMSSNQQELCDLFITRIYIARQTTVCETHHKKYVKHVQVWEDERLLKYEMWA